MIVVSHVDMFPSWSGVRSNPTWNIGFVLEHEILSMLCSTGWPQEMVSRVNEINYNKLSSHSS